ncbi:dienelactone hydrolase family protein [Pantoea ananatis]|uniref:dienelactone hydrolase family protein n=1 Tax=Pantoea ananas TaxID=553 RepID=UPI0024ADA17D|nr:dienelactone hydrolase family protein [Pantoea ananatis]MDI6539867.1 dienelactone hydrolase family protein [Pantoea ananatis]
MSGQNQNNVTVQKTHKGEFCLPGNNANGRAVIVLHEAPGVTKNVRRRSQDLAKLGYVVFAPFLHGYARPLGSEESRAAVSHFYENPQLLRERVKESLDYLCETFPLTCCHIAVIGYCFGGMAALEYARSGAAVAGIVSFHGLLKTLLPASADSIKAPLLVCTGAKDPFVPQEHILNFWMEMEKARADWRLIVFGNAAHSFTNLTAHEFGDERLRYDAQSDVMSWDNMKIFLQECFTDK